MRLQCYRAIHVIEQGQISSKFSVVFKELNQRVDGNVKGKLEGEERAF